MAVSCQTKGDILIIIHFTFAVQMVLIMGQSTISIRVDEKLKKSFDELCSRNDFYESRSARAAHTF